MKRNPQHEFGRRVRALREAAAISQEELAGMCGLHRTYIGSVERGERNISLNNILTIAQALGIDPGKLVEKL